MGVTLVVLHCSMADTCAAQSPAIMYRSTNVQYRDLQAEVAQHTSCTFQVEAPCSFCMPAAAPGHSAAIHIVAASEWVSVRSAIW